MVREGSVGKSLYCGFCGREWVNWVNSFIVTQLLSLVPLCDPMDCRTPDFPVFHHLPEFAQAHVLWVGDGHPAISSSVVSFFSCPHSFPASGCFSSESAFHIGWLKYWSFSFSINVSNEYSGLVSFRMDWFDLLAVHGTLKSLLQLHSSKASILWCSFFFMVQVSYPYMTTGKTIALNIWIFVSKVASLLFNMRLGLS